MRKISARYLCFLLCAGCVLLAGCAAKRAAYDVPVIPVPLQFKQAVSLATAIEPKEPSREVEVSPGVLNEFMLSEWWRTLANTELNALVDRGIGNNADLRIATLRIIQANARAQQAVADELPVLSMPYQAKIEAPINGIGTGMPGESIDSRRSYQLSLRTDWRADLWGERRSMAESAEMQLWRATYQRDDTKRLLIANIVSLYVEYLSLNDRVRVARETESVLRGMLDSVRARRQIGDATVTDLEQQRAAVYVVQATIPGLELQRENAANSLAQLIGVTPASLALSGRGLDSLAFPKLLPGVPANLLLQRPDVRVIEARLLAADADIDVARTRLLPPLDLTAQIGYGSLAFSRLFQPYNLFWSAIANLSATIFDYGKRSNEVVFARALHEELVETYVRVLYAAIREAEDAIASVHLNGKRLEAQKSAADAAQQAWGFSMESYGAGAIDYLVLLDTQRTYHRNLDEFHRIDMERYKGLVALFGALGGGVSSAGESPGKGLRPAFGDTATREAVAVSETPGSRWYTPAPEGGEEYWLVDVIGLQDRTGIAHVWRDLNTRFPELMAGRMLLPRPQGMLSNGQSVRFSWYRLFVASFPSSESAGLFCGRLLEALQRCRVVSSRSDEFREHSAEAPAESLLAPLPVPVVAAEMPVDEPPQQSVTTPPVVPEVQEAPVLVALPEPAFAPAPTALKATLPPVDPVHVHGVQLEVLFSRDDAEKAAAAWMGKGYETYVYSLVNQQKRTRFAVGSGRYADSAQAALAAAEISRQAAIFAESVAVRFDRPGQTAQLIQ